MLIADTGNFFNSNVIRYHDMISDTCSRWVDHYNFMLSLPWNTNQDNQFFQEELDEYLMYDV